jgi:hypothetical protein
VSDAILHVTTRPLDYLERAGAYALELGLLPPRPALSIVAGGLRRLADRSPRPALDLKIIEGKKSWRS